MPRSESPPPRKMAKLDPLTDPLCTTPAKIGIPEPPVKKRLSLSTNLEKSGVKKLTLKAKRKCNPYDQTAAVRGVSYNLADNLLIILSSIKPELLSLPIQPHTSRNQLRLSPALSAPSNPDLLKLLLNLSSPCTLCVKEP